MQLNVAGKSLVRDQRPRGLPFKAGLEGLEAADSKAKGLKSSRTPNYRNCSIKSHKEQCESVDEAGVGGSLQE